MFVLDTNTVIYFFKGMGQVGRHLLEASPRAIGLPAIVLYELEVGIAKSTSPQRRTAQLRTLLSSISLLPFGAAEAQAGGRLRAQLEMSGTPIGPLDTLIAATALSRNATLVTRNIKEFGRVADLKVVNWY